MRPKLSATTTSIRCQSTRLAVAALAAATYALMALGAPVAEADTTASFAAGESTFTVPAGVSVVTIQAVGAAGQNSASGVFGGSGAWVENAVVPVTAGEILYVNVGSAGNALAGLGGGGGGVDGGGAGGGESDVRTISPSDSAPNGSYGMTLASRLVVAAEAAEAAATTAVRAARPRR